MLRFIRRAWPWAVGVLVVGLIVYGFLPGPVEVDLLTVSRGPLLVTVDQEGKTRIKERFVVSAPLTGQLLRIQLDPGDPVQASRTVLAVLEPTPAALLDPRAHAEAEARVKAAESAKLQAEANLSRERETIDIANTRFNRARLLYSRGGMSRDEFDTLENRWRIASDEVRAAEFAVRVAEFEHQQAKAALTRTQPPSPGMQEARSFEIPSPIDGAVLRVFQESAAVVGPGTKLLEIGDPHDLEMEIDVLSTDAVKIRPGAEVIVEHWGGGRPLQGKVRLVEPAGFLKVSALGVEEQRVYVIADFVGRPEGWQTLGDAYRVEARIVLWRGDDVLKVPAGSLFQDGDGWAVFVVKEDVARKTRVEVGRSSGLETQILSGIAEGDRVILHPSDKVQDGTSVRER